MQTNYDPNIILRRNPYQRSGNRGSVRRVSIDYYKPQTQNFQSINNYQSLSNRNHIFFDNKIGSDTNIRLSRDKRIRDNSQTRKLSVSLVKGDYRNQIDKYQFNQRPTLPIIQNQIQNNFQPIFKNNYQQYKPQEDKINHQKNQIYNLYEPYQKLADQKSYFENKQYHQQDYGMKKISSLQNFDQINKQQNSNYFNKYIKESKSDQKLEPLQFQNKNLLNYVDYEFQKNNYQNIDNQQTSSTLNTIKQDEFLQEQKIKKEKKRKDKKTKRKNKSYKKSKHLKQKKSILKKSKNRSKSCKKVHFNEGLNQQKNVSKYIKAEMKTFKRPLQSSYYDQIFQD